MAKEEALISLAGKADAAARRRADAVSKRKTAMHGLGQFVGAVAVSLGVISCTAPGSDEFAPVYLEGADGGLQAQIIGRRDGGFFGESAASTPPAYNEARRWLYVIALPRLSIEVLDISDPTRPRIVNRIGYLRFVQALFFDPSRASTVRGAARARLRHGERGRKTRLVGIGDSRSD